MSLDLESCRRVSLPILCLVLAGLTGASHARPTPETEAARALGIEETRQGRFAEGYVLLLPWVRAHPEDVEARFHASWSAAFLGRTYEAADLLTGLDESDPRVQFLWGKLLFDKRDSRGAIDILEPLVDNTPPGLDLQVRRLLAKALMAEGKADRAVELLAGRVGDDPALALDLALARYEAGDAAGAAGTLAPHADRALERFREPGTEAGETLTVALVYEYGRILMAAARHEQALPYLQAAVELSPDCKQCWQHVAQAHTAAGQRREAEVAQRRFEEIQRREGPTAEAQRQQTLDQQDPTGKVLREAMQSFRAGRIDEALAMLRAESRLRPNDPRTMVLAARMLSETGRLPQALELATGAIELVPTDPNGYYVRGTVYQAMGRVAEARQDYTRALDLAPDHQGAAEALAQLSIQR